MNKKVHSKTLIRNAIARKEFYESGFYRRKGGLVTAKILKIKGDIVTAEVTFLAFDLKTKTHQATKYRISNLSDRGWIGS